MWILMALSHWYYMEVFISLYTCVIPHFALIINPGLETIQFSLTDFLPYFGVMSLSFIFSAHFSLFLHLCGVVDQN